MENKMKCLVCNSDMLNFEASEYYFGSSKGSIIKCMEFNDDGSIKKESFIRSTGLSYHMCRKDNDSNFINEMYINYKGEAPVEPIVINKDKTYDIHNHEVVSTSKLTHIAFANKEKQKLVIFSWFNAFDKIDDVWIKSSNIKDEEIHYECFGKSFIYIFNKDKERKVRAFTYNDIEYEAEVYGVTDPTIFKGCLTIEDAMIKYNEFTYGTKRE